MDELIKQAESLGIKVFKSWDEERLKAEIAKVVEASAASSGDHAVTIEPVTITVDGDPDLVADAIGKELAKAAAKPEDGTQSDDELAQIEADNQAALESVARGEYSLPETYLTIRNLKANPMRALGLDSYGSTTLTMTDYSTVPGLEKRISRGVELGLLKVENVE